MRYTAIQQNQNDGAGSSILQNALDTDLKQSHYYFQKSLVHLPKSA